MNELQILNTYNPFVITGIVLSCLWAGAYILSWLVQWGWAWVDEQKVGKDNAVANKFRVMFSNGWVYEGRLWVYYKYDKDGKEIDHGDMPIYDSYFRVLPIIWGAMLCLNFWYISMWIVMVYAVAFTARMGRRGHKLLTKHIEDKEAHK